MPRIVVFCNSERRSRLGHKVGPAEGECWNAQRLGTVTLFHICFFCHRLVVCMRRKTDFRLVLSVCLCQALSDKQRSLPQMICFFDWETGDPEQSAHSNSMPVHVDVGMANVCLIFVTLPFWHST